MYCLRLPLGRLSSAKCLLSAAFSDSSKSIDIIWDKNAEKPQLSRKDVGLLLTDLNSICLHLADFEEKDADVRAQILQWLSFSSNELAPALSFRATSCRQDLCFLDQILEALDRHLRGNRNFLVKNSLSVADLCVAADVSVGLKMSPTAVRPNLWRWYRRVTKDPAFSAVLQQGFPIFHGEAKGKTTKRILCLHGYRQDGDSFKAKLGAFRKIAAKDAEFVFMTAPNVIPDAPDSGERAFTT